MISRASLEEHLSHYVIDREKGLAELNRVNGIVQDRERVWKAEKNNRVRRRDAKQLWENAKKKRAELDEALKMTIGAEQALQHLIAVADLQEPELDLVSEMGQVEVEAV